MAVRWFLVVRFRHVSVSILIPELAAFAVHTLMILKPDVNFEVEEYTVSQLGRP
jgi:hypothetical protein